jgi:hypothetical protein
MNKEMYSPIYGCATFDDSETISSIYKSLKTKQLKPLHKHIIDIAEYLSKHTLGDANETSK